MFKQSHRTADAIVVTTLGVEEESVAKKTLTLWCAIPLIVACFGILPGDVVVSVTVLHNLQREASQGALRTTSDHHHPTNRVGVSEQVLEGPLHRNNMKAMSPHQVFFAVGSFRQR